ncbi:DEAD/DEAH box helicase [Corynebacterium lizhenjunii]|uniref:DEAD/DEAH box helicase n=1 Tax=Corynebacterium lizhenjunii TaxID=2709394 RepID=A0A7T0KI64_9CORY|nr:DEAD/DEAH box helicase [Corynebacterium lizhenjunii]QPK80163.1 DEAD/DEAH box helicase [Corynebacterium lizhenjunii]
MTTFSSLGLPRDIVQVLARQGITTPFPIQQAAIPDALAGKDILGRGPTGSGKTFTFGLPTLARLAGTGASRPGHPRALILAPTRELAAQIQQRLDEPAAALGLRVLAVVGGVNIKQHIRQLARPVDLLVATPGRAQDLIDQGYLKLSDVRITTLDEADQMADMGFLPQVRKLLRLTPADGQRMLFSATLDGDVNKLVKEFLHQPATHSTAPVEAAVDTMEHFVAYVGNRDDRNEVVLRLGARPGKTIMFMRTKHGVDRQAKKLRRAGINAYPLHGDKGQGARTRAIEGFASGEVPVLVATDIAARGIDIQDVSLVVHVDPPAEHKAYLHRAGRTARGGASGRVLTLVMDEQQTEVATLIRKAGVTAATVDLTDVDSPASAPALTSLFGAAQPSGVPLPPPGQPDDPASASSARSTRAARSTHSTRRRPTSKAGRSAQGRGTGKGASKGGGSSRGGNASKGGQANPPRGQRANQPRKRSR